MRSSAFAAALLPLVLLASACGGGDGSGDNAGGTDEAATADWKPRKAAHGAVKPRLLVSDAGSGRVDVIDVASGKSAGTLKTKGAARLHPTDPSGTRVFAVQGDDDTVQLIDAGIRSKAHGDHEDAAHIDPSVVDGAIDVPAPSHVVAHGDHAAVFADGDAGITMVHLGEGAPKDLAAEGDPVRGGDAHHGVAVPIGDELIASLGDGKGPDNDRRVGAQVIGADGKQTKAFKDCPDLHGEFSPDDDTVLFGCLDGVLKLHRHDGSWEAEKIDGPTKGGEEEKTGTIVGQQGATRVLGDYSEDTVVVIDTEKDTSTPVEVPGGVATVAWDPYWEQGLVLTKDGVLHAIDPEKAEVVAKVQATEKFRTESEDGSRAVVAAAENFAYVLNPTTKEVVEVAVDRKGLEAGRSMAFDYAPRDLAIVGLAPLETGAADEHENDHEGENKEGDKEGNEEEHDHEH
ncbi:hypothetical protein CLV63_109139 [Murinocardiopsis flavida]|uniref:Pyrroloquinoline-quinone binding quinoprotein n=1 Tax=Murinocardiopsis flavida TaxID=645275 RepID=A0A2P8DIT1_9ACTN|nr:hypothetical protein [Murinocardiopsis flavida]PSK97136.1 hypothetical protein CLV63_109139 [Murinocardiopsis flavida]